MSSPTDSSPLGVFLAAVAQFQQARRVLFDTLAEHPSIVLQYTDTLGGRFAEIEGGDLLQELHLYAQQQLTPTEKARAKTHIAH